jgi:16S rRNA (guanine(966)-N(2))-methyltransferase RsmD
MRIISGKFRGKTIKAPAQLPVRPTTDMAKESLFNILNNDYFFEEIKFLDLFAGSGNISFEMASRGCKSVVCVDNNPHCTRFILKMAEQMGFDFLQAVKSDALQFLGSSYHTYDIIFADPPYDFTDYQEILDKIFNRNLLDEEGVFVLEHSKDHDFQAHSHFKESRKYGSVHFSFFTSNKKEEI